MKEKTSSHGSLHFGHYKAGIKNNAILMAHYVLAELPFRTGYSMKRWQQATNVMLLKSSGMYNVDELRTIVLYSADLNHNCKFFGRSLMNHTTTNARIANEQCSRPGRKSIDHALNRRLIFDISRYQKQSIAMTSCDLKSCYDRIAHTPAMLALLGFGIPKEPLLSLFHSIQYMKYYTRTVFGISEDSFGGLDERYTSRPQRFGQGNGAAPQGWSGISSKMFNVMHLRGMTTTFYTPVSILGLELSGLAYVDDADMFADADGENNPQKTLEKCKQQ